MNFKQKGETYGDGTCTYSIQLDKEYTLSEFIDTIFKYRYNEWGYINVVDITFKKRDEDSGYLTSVNIGKYNYSEGNFIDGEFEAEVLSRKIKIANSHGGWSLMNYDIYI